MGLLDRANEFTRRFLTARSSKVLTYQPVGGSPAAFVIPFRTGISTTRLMSEDAYGEELKQDDFLINAAELFSRLGRHPKRADRLVRQIGDATVTYELLPQAGEPEWRWVDQDQTEYRIHGKTVGTQHN